jgi:hypothetical protein
VVRCVGIGPPLSRMQTWRVGERRGAHRRCLRTRDGRHAIGRRARCNSLSPTSQSIPSEFFPRALPLDGERALALIRRHVRSCSNSQNAQMKHAPRLAAFSTNRNSRSVSLSMLMHAALQTTCQPFDPAYRITDPLVLPLPAFRHGIESVAAAVVSRIPPSRGIALSSASCFRKRVSTPSATEFSASR